MLTEQPISALAELIEAVAAPLLVLDLDEGGKVAAVLCNKRFEDLDPPFASGATETQIPGAFRAAIGCCARSAAPIELSRFLAIEGEPRDIRLAPLKGADGVVRRIVGTVTDESFREELIAARDQAETSHRAKSDFLANMSHELRQPLNAIIGFSQIVVDEVFGPIGEPRYLDYLRDIQFSGKHLLNIINDLLDLSKNEVGRLALIEQPTEIAEVIETSIRLLRDKAAVAGVTVRAELPSDLPLVWADEQRLRQVVMNLLSNAIKFTPEGGEVAVTVALDAAGVSIVVSDTGIGMAPEDVPRALEPFVQIENVMTRNREGTGLGLPLSKALIELHGGFLSVQSTPGKGTAVTAGIPVARFVTGPKKGGGRQIEAGAA